MAAARTDVQLRELTASVQLSHLQGETIKYNYKNFIFTIIIVNRIEYIVYLYIGHTAGVSNFNTWHLCPEKCIILILKIKFVTFFNTTVEGDESFYKNKKEHGVEKRF